MQNPIYGTGRSGMVTCFRPDFDPEWGLPMESPRGKLLSFLPLKHLQRDKNDTAKTQTFCSPNFNNAASGCWALADDGLLALHVLIKMILWLLFVSSNIFFRSTYSRHAEFWKVKVHYCSKTHTNTHSMTCVMQAALNICLDGALSALHHNDMFL